VTCKLAKREFDDAINELDTLEESSYKDRRPELAERFNLFAEESILL